MKVSVIINKMCFLTYFRCIDIQQSNEVERTQALRLVRKVKSNYIWSYQLYQSTVMSPGFLHQVFFAVSNTLPYFIKWEEIPTDNSEERRRGNAGHCFDFNLLPLRTLSSRLEKPCWFSCDRDQTGQDSGKNTKR